MPVNPGIVNEEAVRLAVAKALERFYEALVEKIDGIGIKDLMKR